MFFNVAWFTAGFVSSIALVSAQIQWDGYPRAISDLGPDTTLVLGGNPSKATFSYSISGPSGTVRVTLGDNGITAPFKEVAVLEEKFDPNGKEGYTLDLNALGGMAIKSSNKYFIRFVNQAQDIQSAEFTIKHFDKVTGNQLRKNYGRAEESGAASTQHASIVFLVMTVLVYLV